MAPRRCEISLLMLKNISLVRKALAKYFSTLEEKFRISKRPCNILYLCHYCLSQSLRALHFVKTVRGSFCCA